MISDEPITFSSTKCEIFFHIFCNFTGNEKDDSLYYSKNVDRWYTIWNINVYLEILPLPTKIFNRYWYLMSIYNTSTHFWGVLFYDCRARLVDITPVTTSIAKQRCVSVGRVNRASAIKGYLRSVVLRDHLLTNGSTAWLPLSLLKKLKEVRQLKSTLPVSSVRCPTASK